MSAAEASWCLQAIGVVRSPVKERKQMPPLGVPAAIELFARYAPGLLHIEKHSHIWVLAWLEGAERDLLQVVPRGVRGEEPGALHGVFAVRSPARPNPIGLTATRVTGVEGTRIEVARLDFIDGTPVVDIKPYFVTRDLIFAATNVQIGRPSSRASLRESLLEQALNFHGELCEELALGVRVLEHFRWEVLNLRDPQACRVALPFERGCLLDAFLGMTRVSPGRGTLTRLDGPYVRLQHADTTCLYELLAPPGLSPEAVLQAPEATLFRIIPS